MRISELPTGYELCYSRCILEARFALTHLKEGKIEKYLDLLVQSEYKRITLSEGYRHEVNKGNIKPLQEYSQELKETQWEETKNLSAGRLHGIPLLNLCEATVALSFYMDIVDAQC